MVAVVPKPEWVLRWGNAEWFGVGMGVRLLLMFILSGNTEIATSVMGEVPLESDRQRKIYSSPEVNAQGFKRHLAHAVILHATCYGIRFEA